MPGSVSLPRNLSGKLPARRSPAYGKSIDRMGISPNIASNDKDIVVEVFVLREEVRLLDAAHDSSVICAGVVVQAHTGCISLPRNLSGKLPARRSPAYGKSIDRMG
jgi:hypothetical protein